MTLRQFFLGRAIVFSILLLLGLGAFFYYSRYPDGTYEVLPVVSREENPVPPAFTWKFAKSDSIDLDGFPENAITLEAMYPDGFVQDKVIDTVPGSCNELDDPEEGSLPNTSTIQCYSAGLGYRYMVAKGDDAYLIQRKKFEEASPKYDPPVFTYEVISMFPFTNQ